MVSAHHARNNNSTPSGRTEYSTVPSQAPQRSLAHQGEDSFMYTRMRDLSFNVMGEIVENQKKSEKMSNKWSV